MSKVEEKKQPLKKKNKVTTQQVLKNSNEDSPNSLKRKESSSKHPNNLNPKKLHGEEMEISQLYEILGAIKPPDEKEIELEHLVLGDNPEDLEDEEMLDDHGLKNKKDKKNIEKVAAWEDVDDETTVVDDLPPVHKVHKNSHRSNLRGSEKYSDYAQEKYIKLMGIPKWAEQDFDFKDSDDESEDELLQKTGNFLYHSESLPKTNIMIKRSPYLVDPNNELSLIKSVEFHPTSSVAVVASANGFANLFQIDGEINAKIQSIYFENFPISKAHFTVDGTELIVGSSMSKHLFCYDMFAGKISTIPGQRGMEVRNVQKFVMSPDGKYIVIHGRWGNIYLMSAKSKEWIGSLKMNGDVLSITFNRDGTKMYSHGATGEVYVWDMSSRRCIHKFVDEGCVAGTAIAISPNDQFLATGSDSGVVNIYDNTKLYGTHSPEPKKAILNLTTKITDLKFNSTSEILAMSSSYKKEAVRLVHFPSCFVFSNFPISQDLVQYPKSLDFSPNSGYLCIGNNVGKAKIFRLKHYKNY
ncbi:u3 small nucleolar RNA-associated protein 18 homolog [Trichonephila clavata]|uniref:U3 small nucleolar RNA-associated protein 18 homolog n=1 Tax=Trichonephila clavata TaxID=2740835 RepID=A0A8X6GTT9_TRICU|nr:u3 small nucleolar RNA-associated protein 18 homolog [Trichonephila clavata]